MNIFDPVTHDLNNHLHREDMQERNAAYREAKKAELADELIQLPQNQFHDYITIAGCKYDFGDVIYRCKDFEKLISLLCSSNEETALKAARALANNMQTAALTEADMIVDELIEDDAA